MIFESITSWLAKGALSWAWRNGPVAILFFTVGWYASQTAFKVWNVTWENPQIEMKADLAGYQRGFAEAKSRCNDFDESGGNRRWWSFWRRGTKATTESEFFTELEAEQEPEPWYGQLLELSYPFEE